MDIIYIKNAKFCNKMEKYCFAEYTNIKNINFFLNE